MPAKRPPTGTDADLNLTTLSHLFVDENAARRFVESKRWPNGPVCPHCECKEVYALTPKPGSKSPVRPGVYKCKACRKQFTVRIGTIFEESKIPLSKWLMAIHLMTSSKKGVSSRQIERELGVTMKTAWFITHRIREAMREAPLAEMLSGTVEVDETYVGGKPRFKGQSKRGRGTKKQPVMVLVERGGRSRCKPIPMVNGDTLKSEVVEHVATSSLIVTDENPGYSGLDAAYAGHETVKHSAKEYARKNRDGFNVNSNTAESFFALLKRGHYGIFHHISKKHMHRYCDEFSFRWNIRHQKDGFRIGEVIRGAEGKRLMYA